MRKNKRIQSQESTVRQRRVGEEIRASLSSFLARGEYDTPALSSNLITITEVRMSVDLKHAFAFIMPLGGKNIEETMVFLKNLAPLLRFHVAKSFRLKVAPVLHFEIDRSFEEVEKLQAILHSERVAKDLQA